MSTILKENIWTLDAKGELMITIMSSLAQEESRSISENTTWGKRKQFAEGKGSVAYSTFLGYDKDFKVNPEQAKTVQLIYKLFISGLSYHAIAKELEKRRIKAPAGGDKWYLNSVRSILKNEKYRGDALLQKQYTVNFLEKNRKKNQGEVPQYYVEDHHEAIITPAQFDLVQTEIARREKMGRYCGASIFSNKIKCGCCGGWYGSKVWHSNDKYRKVVYRCNHKYEKGRESCTSPNLTEDQIKEIFVKALNQLISEKEETVSNLKELIDTVCRTDTLLEELHGLEGEIEILAERIEKLIRENAKTAQDQEEYRQKEEKLRIVCGEKQLRHEELKTEIQEKNGKREILMNFISRLQELNTEQTAFNAALWGGLVDYITAGSDQKVTVVFHGGDNHRYFNILF